MNNLHYKFMLAVIAAAIVGGLALGVGAQTPEPPAVAAPKKTEKVKIKPPAPPAKRWDYKYEYPNGDTTERAIAVTPKVSLTLCVTQGNLKVNGWNRSEVRVYVENGAKFSFKVIDK